MESQELLTVRGADKRLYKKFRVIALRKKIRTGKALNQALKYWIEIEGKKEMKDPGLLLKIKPVDFGRGSEDLSTRLDEVLYA